MERLVEGFNKGWTGVEDLKNRSLACSDGKQQNTTKNALLSNAC